MPGVEKQLQAGKALLIDDSDVYRIAHLQVLGPGVCYVGDDDKELENSTANNQRGLGYTQASTSSPNNPAKIEYIGKFYAFSPQNTLIEIWIPQRDKGR